MNAVNTHRVHYVNQYMNAINGEKLWPFIEDLLLHHGESLRYRRGFEKVEPEFVVAPKNQRKG